MIIEKDREYIGKFVIIIIFGALIAGLSAIGLMLFFKDKSLHSQLTKDRQTLLNVNEELLEIKTAKERLAKENEKYQADAVSYLAFNTRLSEENDKFQKKINEAQKLIEYQEAQLQRLKEALEKVNTKQSMLNNAQHSKLIKEREILIKKVKVLKSNVQNERMLYHYNLGVAFAQSAFYDDAIGEYEKSLKFSSNNPEAHYNLGLLYDNYKNDLKEAGVHYRKYLELKPDAADKEEVESWIKSNYH